jgi:hypothetical protein
MIARPPKITERILCVISLAYIKPGYFFRVSCLILRFIGWDTAHRMRVPCQEVEMTPLFSFKANVFVLALSFAVISTITYAFASSNTGNFDPTGQGAEAISGYVVTNVSYGLGNDASKIASTSFTLSAPAVKVQIQLSDTQTNWYDCINVSGNNWTCNTNNSSLKSANELQVIALGN